MLCYFNTRLKPLIKAKIDQNAHKFDGFEKLMSKVVEIKAKTDLQLNVYV